MKIPTTDNEVKDNKNTQSISKFWTSPINPINEFIAIMNNEVPMAFFMGKLANKTKDGIIKNPPPAPTKPMISPMIKI